MRRLGRPNSTTRFLVAVSLIASMASALLLADKPFGLGLQEKLGDEAFKLLLQFVLVTVIGGAIFALANARRDEQVRREARIAGLQALDDESARAYRLMKSSKRQLRAKIVGQRTGSLRIPRGAFEVCMDELLKAQLAMEEVQDRIAARGDLIEELGRKRIDKSLRYVARYLHDVYEDFEKGRVTSTASDYCIDTGAENLREFLFPGPLSPEDRVDYDLLSDQDRSFTERHDALRAIETRRKAAKGSRRQSTIATSAARLVGAELKALIDAELR